VDSLAPDVVTAVAKHTRKKRTVAEGLFNDQWIRDIQVSLSLSAHALGQYVSLRIRLQGVRLYQEIADKFIWKWSSSHLYSASSAYLAFFHGQCALLGAKYLSKMVAPACCKFFMWLALLDRCWTSDRRQRHNLDSNGLCAFCDQATETVSHLVLCLVPTSKKFGSGCSDVQALTNSRTGGLAHVRDSQVSVLRPQYLVCLSLLVTLEGEERSCL
jgi:hypothetical protein